MEGEFRKLEEVQLPSSLGDELLATQPQATAVRWGRIAVQTRMGNPTPPTPISLLWNGPTPSPSPTARPSRPPSRMAEVRWPAASQVQVRVESPEARLEDAIRIGLNVLRWPIGIAALIGLPSAVRSLIGLGRSFDVDTWWPSGPRSSRFPVVHLVATCPMGPVHHDHRT